MTNNYPEPIPKVNENRAEISKTHEKKKKKTFSLFFRRRQRDVFAVNGQTFWGDRKKLSRQPEYLIKENAPDDLLINSELKI